jgi:hypothetical protein
MKCPLTLPRHCLSGRRSVGQGVRSRTLARQSGACRHAQARHVVRCTETFEGAVEVPGEISPEDEGISPGVFPSPFLPSAPAPVAGRGPGAVEKDCPSGSLTPSNVSWLPGASLPVSVSTTATRPTAGRTSHPWTNGVDVPTVSTRWPSRSIAALRRAGHGCFCRCRPNGNAGRLWRRRASVPRPRPPAHTPEPRWLERVRNP